MPASSAAPAERESRSSAALRVFVLALSIGLAVFLYVEFGKEWLSLVKLRDSKLDIQKFVDERPLTAPLFHILTMWIVVGINIPGATFLALCAGLFFPQPLSTFSSLFGYLGGGILNYTLYRFVFADQVGNWLRSSSDMFARMEAGLANKDNFWQTVSFLIFIR